MIENFQNARVVVVGDVMLDRYWWGNVNRVSPEAPVPVLNLSRTTSTPGGAANVALNCASLGAEVMLVSAVGDDAEGDELVAALENRGITGSGLLRIPSRQTSVKTRIIAHSQQVTRVDREQVDPLSAEYSDRLIEFLADLVSGTDAVIVSDYAKGTLTDEVLHRLIGLARLARRPVLVDPKGKDYRKYSGASVLTPNRREAAEACKLEEFDPAVVERAGKTLLGEIKLDHVLVTEGELGMTLFSRDEEPFHLDASVHQVYDVTGAGDSVIACLGVSVAAGSTMREACRIANAAGGVSVQHVGTHAVTLQELRGELLRSAVGE